MEIRQRRRRRSAVSDRGEYPAGTQRLLTTGEAARVCSVNPDTVLKWIKAGKLHAIRTTGGHHRVDVSDLQETLAGANGAAARRPESAWGTPHTLRCWEYFGDEKGPPEECKGCVVYQIRASWCFKVGTNGCEFSPAKRLCGTTCGDCFYFQRVAGQPAKVLVVTADEGTISRLARGQNAELELGFARNGYEASAILSSFRPMFVVVDEDLVRGGQAGLLDSLAGDSRAPGMKIVLATHRGRAARWQRDASRPVSAVIAKPIGLDRIAEVVREFPVEVLDQEGIAELAARREGC